MKFSTLFIFFDEIKKKAINNFIIDSMLNGIADRRGGRVVKSAATAFLGKCIAVLVSAVTIPISLKYLGVESYGIWVTISSTVAMLAILDVGISSALVNLISQAYAKKDNRLAAEYFSTAFWVLLVLVLIMGIAGNIFWDRIPWAELFNLENSKIQAEISLSLKIAFLIFLISLPFSLIVKVLAGYQQLHVANLFAAGGSLLSLAALFFAIMLKGHLPLLVGTYAGSFLLANIILMFWVIFFRKPWLRPDFNKIKFIHLKSVFSSSFYFFVIQISGLIVFSSDNVVIAHFLSPADVTPYSVTWRLVSYIVIIQNFIFPALWPAYSEAFASDNLEWVISTYKRVNKITTLVLILGCSLIALYGRLIIKIWAGDAAVPSQSLIFMMCIWIIIYAYTTNQSCLMGAANKIRAQGVFSLFGAIANLFISIYLVGIFGVEGVLMGTILSYLIFIVIPAWLVVRKILKR